MNVVDDMLLPPGKTCADCVSFERCEAFIGAVHINSRQTRCDWAPSRFRQRVDWAPSPSRQEAVPKTAYIPSWDARLSVGERAEVKLRADEVTAEIRAFLTANPPRWWKAHGPYVLWHPKLWMLQVVWRRCPFIVKPVTKKHLLDWLESYEGGRVGAQLWL